MFHSVFTVQVGTLVADDDGVHDPAITDRESDCLIGCGNTTDHVSGVCDACNEADDELPATEDAA